MWDLTCMFCTIHGREFVRVQRTRPARATWDRVRTIITVPRPADGSLPDLSKQKPRRVIPSGLLYRLAKLAVVGVIFCRRRAVVSKHNGD
jgi:hypothetical protein